MRKMLKNSYIVSKSCMHQTLISAVIFQKAIFRAAARRWRRRRGNESDKGQLISKYPLGVIKSSKKPTKFFPGVLP